jgi:hypothetical protein
MLALQINQTTIIAIGVLAAVLAVAISMFVLQIDQSIIIALIGVLGGVLPVGISYMLTKNKEIDFGIRQKKTERYDDLIGALTEITKSGFTIEYNLMNDFIMAYNRASTYASDPVLEKCNDLLAGLKKEAETGVLTPEGSDRIIGFINDVYTAIRKDINPRARYCKFVTLWAEPKEG